MNMMQTTENWVWEQMFDKLPFGAILISAVDVPVAMVNDRFCEITETNRSDLLQLKPSEIQVLSNLPIQQTLESFIYDPTSTLSRDSYFIRHDGRRVHVTLSISLLEPPHPRQDAVDHVLPGIRDRAGGVDFAADHQE